MPVCCSMSLESFECPSKYLENWCMCTHYDLGLLPIWKWVVGKVEAFFYLYANPAGAKETQQTWQQGLGDLETGSSRCLISPWIKQTLLNRSILFNSSTMQEWCCCLMLTLSLLNHWISFQIFLTDTWLVVTIKKTGVFQFQISHRPKWVINMYIYIWMDKLQ